MKRLYRSNNDKMLAGVCGGLAECWETDPALVRLGTALVALVTGFIPLLAVYVLAAIIIPVRPQGV